MTGRPIDLVLGVGSLLWSDDGIGVRLLEGLDGPWECRDGGTGGIDLLADLAGYRRIVILDAVDAGREPGEVFEVDAERLPAGPRISGHQVNLVDFMRWRRSARVEAEIIIIGIQPECLQPGFALGPVLSAHFEAIQRVVREQLLRLLEQDVACFPQADPDPRLENDGPASDRHRESGVTARQEPRPPVPVIKQCAYSDGRAALLRRRADGVVVQVRDHTPALSADLGPKPSRVLKKEWHHDYDR